MSWIKPLWNQVAVKPDKTPDKTEGGLHLPEGQRKNLGTGTVLAVGGGVVMESGVVVPLEVEVGDRVLFPPYAGQELTWGDRREAVLLMRESDIHGILTE